MNYLIDDDVPRAWDHIIQSFVAAVDYNVQFNKMVPIYDVEFKLIRGKLKVLYHGGDKVTDGMAHLVRIISSTVCFDCGVPSTRKAFGIPKCQICD